MKDMSRKRKQIGSLYRRIRTLLETILGRSPIFAASLYEQKVKCGKVQCKCAKGSYRHRMWCVSFMEGGKSRTRVVPIGERVAVEKMTKDYRRFRQARRQMRNLFEEILAAVDKVGGVRAADGRKRYGRLVAKRGSSSSRRKKGGD